MYVTMVVYLTEIALMAFLLGWVVRCIERIFIGVASDKGDAYIASFLSLIGVTGSANLLWVVFIQLDWLYQISRVSAALLIFSILYRAMLNHKKLQCFVLAIGSVVVLYSVAYAFLLIGIEI
jgi:hypothetical protein